MILKLCDPLQTMTLELAVRIAIARIQICLLPIMRGSLVPNSLTVSFLNFLNLCKIIAPALNELRFNITCVLL